MAKGLLSYDWLVDQARRICKELEAKVHSHSLLYFVIVCMALWCLSIYPFYGIIMIDLFFFFFFFSLSLFLRWFVLGPHDLLSYYDTPQDTVPLGGASLIHLWS